MSSKKLIKEFKGLNITDARAAFMKYLGEEGEWFGAILYDIKERWGASTSSKVTDILIVEDSPVRVAVLKSYLHYTPPLKPDGFKYRNPSRPDMLYILEKFYNIKPEDDIEASLIVDFSFAVEGLGIYRVNFSNEINGACFSIRLLSFNLPDFEYVGYPEFWHDVFKGMIVKSPVEAPAMKREKPGEPVVMQVYDTAEISDGGLILHVGPTGSGKTTAIAAELSFLAESTSGRIITYENPIEYRYRATRALVSQFELGENIKKGFDRSEFENATRHLLRGNLTAVMVGEARDFSEMRELFDQASRGHLVLSTIHATNVLEALELLMTAAENNIDLLARTIKGIVAHKLVKNSDGNVFGLHEILIVNAPIKNFIKKKDIGALKNAIYSENDTSGVKVQTFKNSLINLERQRKISPSDRTRIENSNVGLFVE